MRTDHDELLGSALRQLGAPPHGPEFIDRMWAVVDEAMSRPMPSPRRAAGHGVRRRRQIMSAVAVAVAVVIAAGLVLGGVPGWRESAPQVATATEVAQSMSSALRSLRTLQGSVTSDWGEGKAESTFAADSRGDYRWDSRITHQDDVGGWDKTTTVFDALTNTLLEYGQERKGPLEGQVTGRKRVPSPTELVSGIPFHSMAGLVRSALAEGDPRIQVTEVVYRGRLAWQATFPRQERDLALSGLRVIVDQPTGVLLCYWHSGEHGEHGWTYTVSRLRANETLPPATFATTAPQGAHIVTSDASAFCSLDEAAVRAGYNPFMPQATPGPFKLTDVAAYPHVNGTAEFFGPWFPNASGQRPPDEVFLRYQLGLDAFSIRQAPVADSADRRVLDRQAQRLRRLSTYQSELLKGGAFAGETALTWFTGAGAFLQVDAGAYCLLISGDLTRREMLAVADSLAVSR